MGGVTSGAWWSARCSERSTIERLVLGAPYVSSPVVMARSRQLLSESSRR